MNSTDLPFTSPTDESSSEINYVYTISEVLVAAIAVVGNALVILVFRKEKRLRRRTNYYIVSLAAADFLVGLLGIPFAIMSSVGLPRSLYPCLFTVSLLLVLCTISIFCLVAVSVDRYWAILYPMGYSRNVRTKTALVIITICWLAGSIIGFLPLMGWHKQVTNNTDFRCLFLKVMDYNYLVFLYFGTIMTSAILLMASYAHIYRVVVKQLRQIVTMNPESGTSATGSTSGGTMLRMLGAAQKREVKATQNLSIIVLFFMVCWVPLYTYNCVLAFCSQCTPHLPSLNFCIILSHVNSAGNPLLYAYHLKDFRAALKHFLLGLLGHNPPPPSSLNWRASLASNTGFNNYSQYRLQSLRESRSAIALSPQNKFCNESLIKRESSRSINLPTPSTITSIFTNSVALAAVTACEARDRDMWRISEVGSTSEEPSKDKELSSHHDRMSRILSVMRSSSSDSGNVNSGYDEGRLFYEDGSDRVFFDDILPNIDDSDCDHNHSDNTSRHSDFSVIKKLTKHKNMSSSSPQLSRNLFIVDSDNDEQDSKKVSRSIGCMDNDISKCKQKKFYLSSSEFISSPSRSVTLSPLRVVSELLKPKYSDRKTDEDQLSPKSSNAHKNGTIFKFINKTAHE